MVFALHNVTTSTISESACIIFQLCAALLLTSPQLPLLLMLKVAQRIPTGIGGVRVLARVSAFVRSGQAQNRHNTT